MARHVARIREDNTYKFLVGNFDGKTPLGRHRCKWENNIKMVLKGTVYQHVDWIHLTQNMDQYRTLVKTAMKFRMGFLQRRGIY